MMHRARLWIFAALTSCLATPAFGEPHDDLARCRANLAKPETDRLQDATWYLPTADGKARLYVTELGCGDPVVFLHGGPGNDFQYFLPALRRHLGSHRFVLFDQRGSLLSPVAPEADATLSTETLIADLESLRAALGVERLTIVGHSWGTLLALLYAQRHPDHVAKLVLTAAFPAYAQDGLPGLLTDMRARQHDLRARPKVAAALAAAGLGVDPKNDTPRQASTRRRIQGNAALNVYHVDRWHQFYGGGVYYNERSAEAISGTVPAAFDFRMLAARTGVPITVIQGDHDYIGPGAKSWQGLPGVSLTVLRDASHYGWIDDPARFHAALSRALAR